MNPAKILVVEDEAIVALSLKRWLEGLGYQVAGPLARGEDAVAQAPSLAPDLVLMDIHLAGDLDGVAAADQIQGALKVPVIYLTAYAQDATLERARGTSPYGYIIKPFNVRELHASIQMALERRAAERQVEQRADLLKLALNAADMATFEVGPDKRLLLRTGRIDTLCDFALAPVAGLDDFLVRVDPADRSRVEDALREAAADHKAIEIEFRARSVGGRRWLRAHGKLTEHGLVGVVSDVTERRRTADQLRQAAGVLDATAEGIFVFDRESIIVSANQAAALITGYTTEELVGRDVRTLDAGTHDADYYTKIWRSLKETGQWQGERWERRKNGELYPAWVTIGSVRDEQGKVTHNVSAFSDISALRQAEARLEHLAHYDALTGLPNRILLIDRLDGLLASADRHGHHVALMFIDIDRFKVINDTLGHAAGDRLLQVVAERLGGTLRAEDTLARLGGDEFVVLLPGVQRGEYAATVATKLLHAASQPVDLEGRPHRVSASIGIGLYPDDASDRQELMRAADAAMYQAKANGKNAYAFFDAHLSERAREELFLDSGLRQALEDGHLELHYQPQLAMPGPTLVGVEALLRWNHPQRGLIPPGRFIGFAEQSGLINELGRWVLTAACRQMLAFDALGVRVPRVAVNLSPRQMAKGNFAAEVAEALAETGLAPDRLEIEITESAVQHTDVAIKTLRELRQLGVSVSMDDFGTGYSSLAALRHLPLDRMKIDRAFVHGLPDEEYCQAIVSAVLSFSQVLGIEVLAEGVEREAQLAYLTEAGCEQFQGFLLGRPMPADVLAQWSRDR